MRFLDVNDVGLDHQEVPLARLLHDTEHALHLDDLFQLFVDEPLQEALGEIVLVLDSAFHQRGNLPRDVLLPVQRGLHGFLGRKAGLAAGFSYSEAVSQSGVVWSAETLDQWLARPSEFLPGNRMVFVGIRKPEDRANLIAYLKRETGAQ